MPTPRFKETDCLVVGCGILGLMTAVEMSIERKCRVLVLAPPEKGGMIPERDTLRNHAWLQSGLLYGDQQLVSARRMRPAGLMMLNFVGVRAPTERGIFRFRGEGEAEKFLSYATRLQLRNRVEEVSDFSARRELGEVYEKGFHHFWVPDAPFDETAVLEAAQRIACERGVEFLPREASLVRSSQLPNGYAVMTGSETIIAPTTILCAGAGLPKLLDQLNIIHSLRVTRSVLLRVYNTFSVRAALLADRASNFSIIRHSPRVVSPAGCLVIGGGGRQELKGNLAREVPEVEKLEICQALPESIREVARKSPATAGHKTETSSVDPWIQSWPEFPGLIAAIPGKATMAYWTARRIVESVKTSASRALPIPPYRGWQPQHRMHHLYSEVDETTTGHQDENEE
jgi:glycine/D-amino acid oxidase-like deaminating enzyme